MDKQVLNDYYKILNTDASLCLYPGMSCSKKPIKAHSIQNSKVFDLLNLNGHLIGLKIKPNSSHIPEISFSKISRNNASVFKGFCSEHDNEIFKDIDDLEFNVSNQKQLFLLAYRSIAKALHASISKARKLQAGYLTQKKLGLLKENNPSKEGAFAVQCMDDAYEANLYKNQFDKALISENYQILTHRIFEVPTSYPKLACSQLFSNDSVQYKDSISRIIMNIFPKNEFLTYAIFSSTKGESEIVDDYLYKCINSDAELRSYEISKMVIKNSENFFINPIHFETWSKSKKDSILNYLVDTIYKDKDIDDIDYQLF